MALTDDNKRRMRRVQQERPSKIKFNPHCDGDLTPEVFTNAVHQDGEFYLIAFPEVKMAFCGIPKNGISGWIQFFRYMLGAEDFTALPHYKEDIHHFHMYRFRQPLAQDILNDPTWSKGVVFRDPAERLLSAYFDKMVRAGFAKRYQDEPMTFPQFVDIVSNKSGSCEGPKKNRKYGVHACTDPHWRPQVFIGGLHTILPKFNFIGNFNQLGEFTKEFLDSTGLWKSHGAEYRTFPTKGCSIHPQLHNATYRELLSVGFNQRSVGDVHHATHSVDKMDEYYTDELMQKVREAYHLDYIVWNKIKAHKGSHMDGAELCSNT